MSARRKKSFGVGWIVLLALVVFGTAGAVTYYMKSSGDNIKPMENKPVVNVTPQPVVPVDTGREVTIFLPRERHNRFYLVPSVRKTDMQGGILEVAMKVLLSTTSESGEAGKLIPEGTRLLAPLKVHKGVAFVDFSKELRDNFNGGSTQESLLLNSIAHTLVYNSEGKVQSVRILLEGEAIEELGGHFELTDPITPDASLLKPGSKD